ncbi:unnamed protein product [Menidia menidia]|uniref:(Atlantic silverside) hypothetical protein n=1 Tax=Menidia menidia TaxID=238744 RepID=A0A8S4BUM2_9TELE|nr:unnamed protein product [Menidia menidia]
MSSAVWYPVTLWWCEEVYLWLPHSEGSTSHHCSEDTRASCLSCSEDTRASCLSCSEDTRASCLSWSGACKEH